VRQWHRPAGCIGRRRDDWLRGDDWNDFEEGGRGDDLILGFGGGDSIHGGPDSDSRIDAGTGRDLTVDVGHNQINCGKGVDRS
jgi:hypothetical protein